MTDMFEKEAAAVDWSIFDWPVSQTCYCRCGAEYRSHAKINMDLRRTVSKDPCPECGSHGNLRMSSSDPETMTLRG